MVTRLISLCLFVLTSTQLFAGVVIDQVGGGPNVIAMVNSSTTYQQEVTAGVGGDLVGVDIWSWGTPFSGQINLEIYLGHGWKTGAPLASRSFTPSISNGRMLVDFSSTPVPLAAGDEFVISASATGSAFGRLAYGNNDYAGHSFSRNMVSLPNNDLTFQTHMNTSSIPEPSPVMLLAFAAVIAASRRRYQLLSSLKSPRKRPH